MNNQKSSQRCCHFLPSRLGFHRPLRRRIPPTPIAQAGVAATDAAINGKVSAVLMSDPSLTGSKIRVNTTHRVVSLQGTVEAEAAGLRAIELASSVEGVERVVSVLSLATR